MSAFYADVAGIHEQHVELTPEEAHHLHVRRIGPGEQIDVIDGLGTAYRVCVEHVGKSGATCRILQRLPGVGESATQLHLAVSMIKGQRFDTVVEKATEVGVYAIHPMLSERGVVRGAGKADRWSRIARAAAKQCGRSRIPVIAAARPMSDVVTDLARQVDMLFMGSPHANDQLGSLPVKGATSAALFVGPEGGFDAHETTCLEAAGVRGFVWGSRVLRADTAAIVLSALILDHAEAGEGV